MELSSEIRRKVLVVGASKRSSGGAHRIGSWTLDVILREAEPPTIG